MDQIARNMRALVDPLGPIWPIILVPIWQEFLFRYLPYRFIFLPFGKPWLVIVITSLIFASIHWYCKTWFIVLTFFAGIFLWWLMAKYGLIAAILFHALSNAILWVLGLKNVILK